VNRATARFTLKTGGAGPKGGPRSAMHSDMPRSGIEGPRPIHVIVIGVSRSG
jgi:hypothetical protein